jgi:transposase
MRVAPKIILSHPERESLAAVARSTTASSRDVLRARIALRAAGGMRSREIATAVGASANTVGKWRRRLAAQGAAGLADAPRPGRKPLYAVAAKEEMVARTLAEKPADRTHWSARVMAEVSGMGRTTVLEVWRQHGIKPHLERTFKLSTDKHFTEKLRDVVGLYLNPPEHSLVFCVDEKSQIQALDRTQPGLPMKRGRNGTRTHDYLRHGTCCLFAALNVLTGEVLEQCETRHRHQEYLKFLRHIDHRTPPDLDLHLIADNYCTHKHHKVVAWLERHPRFHVHFIPTSSSWLNLVERFFGKITQERIRRGVFHSVLELIAAIHSYIEAHNRHPRPFVWVKTADDILAKLEPIAKLLNKTIN